MVLGRERERADRDRPGCEPDHATRTGVLAGALNLRDTFRALADSEEDARIRALEESERRHRMLLEALPEAVMVHVDGKIAYSNAAGARVFGGRIEQLIGHSILEFATPATRALIRARMEISRSGGVLPNPSRQSFLRLSDGHVLHFEVNSIPFVYDDQPATLSMARDLTQRVEAESALDFERRRLGVLLEKAPAFIAALRGSNHIIELANEAFHTLVGCRTVIGLPALDAIPELRGTGLMERLDEVTASGQPFVSKGMPIMLVRRPGCPPEKRYVDFVYQPLIESDGTRSGMFLHGVDVTDATIARRRIRAQFHAVPVPTYVWQRTDAGFVLIDFNQAAHDVTKDEIANILGQSAQAFFADMPEVCEEMQRCLETRVTIQREMESFRRSTGEMVRLRVTYAAAPPDLVIIHADDITARSKLEQQLQQAQKMEAVGRLAGGVAHDFNNVLSVILTYSDLAMRDLEAGNPLRADLAEIYLAGQRAAELTRQLLAFSRKQILQPRVIDLAAIVGGMSSMLGRLLGEHIELAVLPANALGRVVADPGQIEQVVMNLALNARDAMPDGGKLTIETVNVHLDDSYARAQVGVTAGEHIMLAISDTGVGMTAALRQRIFEPFFTTKPTGKGTGLGLATVFGIAQQSGGHVSVYSEPGHGSTFKVYLPRTDRTPDTSVAAGPPALRRGTETILLVEDEDQVRAVAATILRRHGYEVVETSNGAEALAAAKKLGTKLDLVLTDVVMPRMSGRKLAEALLLDRPDLKVLFASGYTDDAIVHHGVLEEGVAFVQKPFTPDALLLKVRDVLDG